MAEPQAESSPSLKDYKENYKTTQALNAEADFQRASHAQGYNGVLTRAALLISVSAVLVGLNAANHPNLFAITSAVAAVIAAAFGISALFPHKYDEVDIRGIEKQIWGSPEEVALKELKDHKVTVLRAQESSLDKIGWSVRIGFVFLLVSMIAALVAFIVGGC